MKSAILFDLDGTLTVPILDFDAIRAEIGIAEGPVLEGISVLEPERRALAENVLYRHERHAAENAQLQFGAAETLAELRRRGYAVGILTRNATPWARMVLDRFSIEVDGLRCRDDGVIKPEPDGVLALCEQFVAKPEWSWMVGDYLFDIVAGERAGLTTVLMIGNGDRPPFADQADHVIESLPRLLELVAPCEIP